MEKSHHYIRLDQPVLHPQDGLLLGNGDLSVSVYQAADEIRFRFGKGDVWDRRIDFTRDAKPAHIDEVCRGIEVEGWECGPYGGAVEARHGSADEERMRGICQGCPPSYHEFPYPCPKPVGELAMRLPGDAKNLRITQTLDIEKAEVSILCEWENGLALSVVCHVANPENILCLEWKLTGWTPRSRYGGEFAGVGPSQPVWFRLYRWADPTIESFGNDYFSRHRHPGLRATAGPTATPLPPPSLKCEEGSWGIIQDFPSDACFPDGFQCAMAPVSAEGMSVEAVPTGSLQTAMLHLLPSATEGRLAIGVATTTESAEPLELLSQLGGGNFEGWRDSSTESARAFWARSAIDLGGSSLEQLWYASLHAKRCIYRADTIPPGLFLPSTIDDYALWHGDYHTNYNFQSIFLGDYESNHPELGDAYFRAMDFFLSVGRKVAREYYGCRGAFIQLSGYPTHAADDIIGTVPMGRMAYMTGWASNMYWWRYQFSMDRNWLAETGYPALRDCALFYTDFLQRGEDGFFHAFPSNQGEDGFSGNPDDFRDRPQIIRHARYCLRNAIQAAEALDLDHDLATQWRTILAHLAHEDGDTGRSKLLYPDTRSEALAPELYAFDGNLLPCGTADGQAPAYLDTDHESYRWYPGKLPYLIMQSLRTGVFRPDRDFDHVRKLLERWTHGNGLLWGMSVGNYGHTGAWTESLGITGALQDLLMQSWDGVIRIFPGFPSGIDASFTDLRAVGAFLVSASRSGGVVGEVSITSLRGGTCVMENPWPGRKIAVSCAAAPDLTLTADSQGLVSFSSENNLTYTLTLSHQ